MEKKNVKKVRLKKKNMSDFSFDSSVIKVCLKRKHAVDCDCDMSLMDMCNVCGRKFTTGVYIDNFDVLHLGHVRTMIESSHLCDKLIIAIDTDGGYESEYRLRYRWVHDTVGHIRNVSIVFISLKNEKMPNSVVKNSDVIFGWNVGERFIKSIGAQQQKIFSYFDCNLSVKLDKSNVLKYWDFIPNVVRPHFVKKVLIIGGESTGKSTLGVNLSSYYNTNYLEELGRTFSEKYGTNKMMIESDFSKLILTNKIRELEDCKYSNRVMFQDTDCLTTRFYLDFLGDFGSIGIFNKELSEIIARINSYDLVLFLEPDNKFVMDSVRSEKIASDRLRYSNDLKEIYKRFGFNVISLKGSYEDKFRSAVAEVDKILGF